MRNVKDSGQIFEAARKRRGILRPSEGNQNLPFNPRIFLTVYFYSLPSRPSLCSARFLSSSSDMTTIFLWYSTTTGVREQSFICFVNNRELYTHTMSSLLKVHINDICDLITFFHGQINDTRF
jgi:hypothetical protein